MLEPEYFNDKADIMIEIYQELEDFIFKNIANILLKSQSVSGTADRLIWKLEQMGKSRAEIMKKLSQITGLSRRELQSLLQDAVITSWNDDLSAFNMMGIEVVNPLENAAVMSVMDAEYRKCQGELENLTRTAMNQSQNDLARMLNEAEMRVASGVQSYSGAICDILDNYAGKGLMIDYPTGTRRSLEAAVRMCVVTSMNQTCAQITNQYIVEGNVEYVLVSAHQGARIQQPGQPYLAGHENWQGKVYRIRGSEPGYPNLREMTGYDIDENGSGKIVNPLGLHGYNCRHSHKPWDKSLRNPYVDENGNSKIDTKKSRDLYEKQQKQRAMERAIRKTKRQLLMKQEEIDMVAEMDVKEILQSNYDRIAYKLRQQNAAYNEFCDKNNLQIQSDRLKVSGFKRAQAAKSTGRARAYEHWKVSGAKNESIVNSGERGIINSRNMANGYRKPQSHILTEDEISFVKQAAADVGIPESVLRFNKGTQTGYLENVDMINIRGDIFPDMESRIALDRMSVKAVLAHEYYGHRAYAPSKFPIADWRDEFRASYMAAINTPNLNDEERALLFIDAYDRAERAGYHFEYSRKAKEAIYGYE